MDTDIGQSSALTSMAEIAGLFSQRPIILRHQKAALYHPFIEAVAMTLVDIPIAAITLLVFAAIVYEAVRLQQSAGQFLYVGPSSYPLIEYADVIVSLCVVYFSCSFSRPIWR
jgi:ABC-type multidrug transport system permease subunit